MKYCPKCNNVVKDWDVVCPHCKSTLIAIAQPPDSAKTKGQIPAWGDYSRESFPARKGESEFNKKLVRAAIKSDYEKGKKPPQRAFEALGHVSFIEKGVQSDEQKGIEQEEELKEIDEIEEIDEVSEMEGLVKNRNGFGEAVDELNEGDIIESVESQGPIVFEGKKREPKEKDREPLNSDDFHSLKALLDAPIPSPSSSTSGKFKPLDVPRVAPPPREIVAKATKSTPEEKAEQDLSRGTTPQNVQTAAGMDKIQKKVMQDYDSKKQVRDYGQNRRNVKTIASSPSAGEQSDSIKYDPETLKRIMQQAQAAAMMRQKGMQGEQHISLPVAILLITMGILSLVGIALIIYILART